jgi:hypothetical protein
MPNFKTENKPYPALLGENKFDFEKYGISGSKFSEIRT